MSNMRLSVSIIIPVYNVEKYLVDCLESALNQTYMNYEIICIDDASTDNSYTIVKEMARNNARIKLYKNLKNEGLSVTRNRALSYAQGDYILFLDSDDIIRKDALELLTEKAGVTNADIVQFDYHHLFEDGVDVWYRSDKANYHDLDRDYSGQDFFVELINNRVFEAQACIRLFRREFLHHDNIRFYEGILHEDYLFCFQCFMKAKRVACLDEDLYTYRKRKTGITNLRDIRRSQSYFIILIEVLKIWDKNHFSKKVRDAISVLAKDLFFMYISNSNPSAINRDLPFGKDVEKWIYHILKPYTTPVKEYIQLTSELIARLKKEKKIYIYGAGNYGKELFEKISEQGIYVEAFIVSNPSDNKGLCKGRNIIPIDFFLKDDFPIVLAVSNNKIDTIVTTLRKKKLYNYILLKDREQCDTLDYWNMPIRDDKVLFFSYGSNGLYSDHCKYITEQLLKISDSLDIVWAIREDRAEYSSGIRTISLYDQAAVCKEAATAAIWICNDPLPPFLRKRPGQRYIQTKHWSSITLKRFYLDDHSFDGVGDYMERWKKGFEEMDYCLVGSKFDEDSCRKGFAFEGEFIYVGSPRTDAMFHEADNKKKVYDYYHIPINTYIALYAPTFRYEERTKTSISPTFSIDYERLSEAIKERFGGQWIILIRMHPQINIDVNSSKYGEGVINVSSYPDGQEIASAADIMISDYSSIMFEPAYVYKPVFLYAPDYKEYVGKKKDLLMDYETLPFQIAETMEELCERIKAFDIEIYKRKVMDFFENYGIHEDGKASERAAEFIVRIIDENNKRELDHLINGLLEYCDSQKSLFLYGAGKYGKALGIYLKNIGYKIDGYITTDKSEKFELLSIPIKTVYEWNNSINDAGVIICAGDNYYGEISRTLELFSCNNTYHIEQKLYQEITRINHTASPFQPIVMNPKNKIISLYYHRVLYLDSDPWNMAITPEEFERHLKYLSENFDIVRFEDDWEGIDDKAITITFDDGYYDFYCEALPLLEKYKVPATIFISTANIGTEREFWWDRLERLLWHSKRVPDIIHVGDSHIRTDSEANLKNALASVRLVLKESYTMDGREHFLDELESQCEGTKKPDMPYGRTMTEQEIKELALSDYITIGAHTVTHAALEFTDDMEQEREISDSIRHLEDITAKPINTFSFPYGSYNENAVKILKEIGIKRCRTIQEDIVRHDTDPLLTPGINAGSLKLEELAQRIANLWNDNGDV